MDFKEKNNRFCINILLSMLFLNILLNFISPFAKIFLGISNTSIITLSIYIVLFFISFKKAIKYQLITIEKIIIYLCFIIFFIVNYILFENSRKYLVSENMILVYVFYLPLCIFIISSINNWWIFIEISYKYCVVVVFLATLILIFGFNNLLNYMEFSYSLLPFLCILLIRLLDKFKIKEIIILIIGIIILCLFGARSPLIFFVLLLIYWQITHAFSTKAILLLLSTLALSFIAYINIDVIFLTLAKINLNANSYIITNILSGNFLKSSSRQEIYIECREIIKNMGIGMYGLFGDRNLTSGVYSHNIIYEILISYGWIIGSLIIGVLFFLILRAYFISDSKERIIIIMFSLALFARYFISGSFIMEEMFYIYFAIIFSVIKSVKRRKRESA